jgi:hypothetical protein
VTAESDTVDSGALRFSRYAYPPNLLGYCGPNDHAALLERTSAGASGPGLDAMIRAFAGAWPYLELIAGAAHDVPLSAEVVEAYWLGSPLLDAVHPRWLAASMDDRFAARLGTRRSVLTDLVTAGAVPDHSFHVLAVSPWIGLLRAGFTSQPLMTMDRCRIRAGTVLTTTGTAAVVETDGLVWDGRRLSLEQGRVDTFTTDRSGHSLAGPLHRGDTVTLHWDWVCERITPIRARRLRSYTARSLRVVGLAPTEALGAALG